MGKSDKKSVRQFSDLSMPAKEKAQPRVLTGKEIKKLIKGSRGIFRTILIVLALSGMRINEVLGLAQGMDFANKVIHVESPRTREDLEVQRVTPALRIFL